MAINDYDDLILGAANQYNVDPKLLKATMQVESGGNPNLPPSSANARGLMQFIPSTAKQYGVDVNDPHSSIYGAAHYISDLLTQYKSPDIAMQHYSGNNPSYGRLIVNAYQRIQAPVAGQGGKPPMTDPQDSQQVAQLPPDEMQILLGGKTPPASTGKPAGAPAAAPPPAAAPKAKPPAAAPADPKTGSWDVEDQRPWDQRLDDLVPSWMKPSAGVRNYATAAAGGAYQGFGNIGTNLGLNVPPLPADAQDTVNKYPITAGVGRFGAEVAGTAPALAATEAVPELLAARYAPWLLRGARALPNVLQWGARGAAAGAEQNVLAGDPNEDAASRAEWGAAAGAPFGVLGGQIGNWFGAARTLEPDVVNAARVAQREGVSNITSDNLRDATINARGAPPSPATGRQIDNAVSRILDDNVPDFTPNNMQGIRTRIGSAVRNAANAGHVDATPAFDQELNQVSQEARTFGVSGQIDPLITQIRRRVANGRISGQDFDTLVGAGSDIHDLIDSDVPYVGRVARELDQVMDRGFQNSSPPGTFDDWVDARTRYRLLMAAERNLIGAGHINPSTFFRSVQRSFPDLRSLTAQSGNTVGRMGEFANAINQLYGGSVGGTAPAARSGIGGFARAVMEGGGIGTGLDVYNALINGGGTALHLGQAVAPAVGAAATAGLKYAGNAYQRSQPFLNSLIARGGRAAGNRLLPLISGVGTQGVPDWKRP